MVRLVAPSSASARATPEVVEPRPDAASIDAFVRAHYGFAFRVLRRAGLSPSDADDAAQRVFLIAAGRIAEIQLGSERAFLYRTARRVASVAHRTARRRPDTHELESDVEPDAAPPPDELVEQRRARALLDSILRELPEDLSAALVLFDIEGLTKAEVAEALGVPPGTVASRVKRARAEVEAHLMRRRARALRHGGALP